MQCTKAKIDLAIDQCQYVRRHCDDFSFFSLPVFHYCHADQHYLMTGLVALLILMFLLRYLEYISDSYLSQAISKYAKYLRLSEALAGVTLLAFSNGATDIITALVSSFNSKIEGVELMIGALFGASTFAILCIFGVIIYSSDSGTVDTSSANLPFIIAVYLTADLIVIGFGFLNLPFLAVGARATAVILGLHHQAVFP
jgi:Ca2+/Na+ antiporter